MKKIIIALILLFSFVEAGAQENKITVAVLPFKNVSGEKAHNWLSETISESITTKLGESKEVSLIERAQLLTALQEFKYIKSGMVDVKTAVKIGKQIGAKIVVIGSYTIFQGKLKIDARFVDVETAEIIATADDLGLYTNALELSTAVGFKLYGKLTRVLDIKSVSQTATAQDVKKPTKLQEDYDKVQKELDELKKQLAAAKGAKEKKEVKEKITAQKNIQEDILQADELFNKGYAANEKGEYRKAIEYYTKVVALQPNAKDALNNIGLAYSRLNELQNAEKFYMKALEIDPKYAISLNGMGLIMWKAKKYSEAEAYYKKAIQNDPKYYLAYYNMGVLYEDMGKLYGHTKYYEESKKNYRKTLEINPSYANAMINLGIILETKDKNYSDAEYWYKRASQVSPDNHLAYYNLGFLYSNKEFSGYNADTAIGYYRKVTELKPDHDLSYFYIGNLYYGDKKDYPNAIAAYEKAIQLYGKDAAYYNNIGLVYEAQKNYTRAESYYRKSIEVDPKYGAAWESLGYAMYYQNRHNEAKDAWKKAISLGKTSAKDALKKHYNITDESIVPVPAPLPTPTPSPSPSPSPAPSLSISIPSGLSAYEYYSRGYDYKWNKNDPDTAIQYYLKAISIDPNHENTLFELGYAYNEKKEYDKAIEYYNRVLAINPRAKDALNNIGLSYEYKKDYVTAESYYRKSIAVDPSYGLAWESLGYALYYQYKDNEAIEAWKKAASLGREKSKEALKKYFNITY